MSGRGARSLGPWLVLGAVGWIGLFWLAATMLSSDPPRAGFDLALLLEAGARVLTGDSPYDAAMLGGTAPSAEDLFYSYPPPVAQAMAPFSGLPLPIVLSIWWVGAVSGYLLIVRVLARWEGAGVARWVTVAFATAPFVFPFAVALLFGNLDAFYPLLYGALVLAVLIPERRALAMAAGVALAVASVAKLHPATIAIWLAVVALRRRSNGGITASTARLVLGCAAVTGVAVVVASIAIGGLDPWSDYVRIIRAGAGADVVDGRNIAPVSILGQLTAAEPGVLTVAHLVVVIVAVVTAGAAAWRVDDPLTSVAIAMTASLIVLPVTWYHYPVALMPIAVALAMTRPSTRPFIVAAIVVAGLAVAWLPATWIAAALVLVGAWRAPAARAQTSSVLGLAAN